MKGVVYLIGLAVLGYVGYTMLTRKSNGDGDIIQDPVYNKELLSQPQQIAPLEIPVTPRVDNADQPWYTGSREFMGSIDNDNAFSDILGYGKSLTNYDTTSFWQELGSKYVH